MRIVFLFVSLLFCVACSPVREIKVKDSSQPTGERVVTLGPQIQKNGILFKVKAPADTYALSIAGSFNQWNPDVFRFFYDKKVGIWSLFLPKAVFGRRSQIEFKYIKNGTQWLVDPLTKHTKDGYGSQNSVIKLVWPR